MTFINYAAREINCQDRLLRSGPVRKTTKPAVHLRPDQPGGQGKAHLAGHRDGPDPVLRLPAAGPRHGPRLQDPLPPLYGPRQVFYDASRKLILKGVDGVVFVADSQEARMDANIESLQNLDKNLVEHGFDLQVIPYVLQLNKRDLPTALPVDVLYRSLNFKGEPTFEATAPLGIGVFDTLKAVAKQVLMELRKK